MMTWVAGSGYKPEAEAAEAEANGATVIRTGPPRRWRPVSRSATRSSQRK
jgi:hypothetical protein